MAVSDPPSGTYDNEVLVLKPPFPVRALASSIVQATQRTAMITVGSAINSTLVIGRIPQSLPASIFSWSAPDWSESRPRFDGARIGARSRWSTRTAVGLLLIGMEFSNKRD
ncbi:hypothetical protein [Bradyrhizobium sp. BR 1433]|uniref:hypothetical protein n=1 Tax=Bradyrhizobium sp. BR 1433 TaxID=3447967 RepID=UPI003EE7BA54